MPTLKKSKKKGKKRLVMNFVNACCFVVFKEAYHWMPGRKGIAMVMMPRNGFGSVPHVNV